MPGVATEWTALAADPPCALKRVELLPVDARLAECKQPTARRATTPLVGRYGLF